MRTLTRERYHGALLADTCRPPTEAQSSCILNADGVVEDVLNRKEVRDALPS